MAPEPKQLESVSVMSCRDSLAQRTVAVPLLGSHVSTEGSAVQSGQLRYSKSHAHVTQDR
jgi:hypothetical protein